MHPVPPGPLPSAHWRAGDSAQITPTTVGGVLLTAASRFPGRTALISGERRWSYADLLAEASGIARALLGSLSPGDVVAVWAENRPEWVALEFAAGLAGLIFLPLDAAAAPEHVTSALAHSGARAVFSGTYRGDCPRAAILRHAARRLPNLRLLISLGEWETLRAAGSPGLPDGIASLPEVDPAFPAQIVYTPGTDGQPKAALLTHCGLTNNARLAAAAFGARDGDVIVNPVPLSSAAGCGLMTLGIAQLSGTHVLMPRPDPGEQLALTEAHRGTLLYGTPGSLARMRDHETFGKADTRSVRAVVSGGARISPDLALDIERAVGAPVLTALTQTECGCVIAAGGCQDALADRLAGAGRPLPGTEVKITDPRTGITVRPGVTGEIRVRGYQVMLGYLDDPVATSDAIGSDGWLRTGDLGSIDDRGYLRVAGRMRDLIIRDGHPVYPCEVEMALLAHPDVAEAAVVGVRDRSRGETVTAVVRLSSPLGRPAATLRDHCAARLAAREVPERWVFTGEFPRAADGRIRKYALRARLADSASLPWTGDLARALAAGIAADHRDPPDLPGPLPGMPGPRVPRQERRAKALEDIGFLPVFRSRGRQPEHGTRGSVLRLSVPRGAIARAGPGRERRGTSVRGEVSVGSAGRYRAAPRKSPGRVTMPAKSSPMGSEGFTAAERAAMKQRAAELRAEGKKGAKKADDLQALLDSIAKMTPEDRGVAERVHATVTATAPELSPKTWYGMPAYADAAGKVVVCFKNSGKFGTRYSTLEFQDAAHLDDGVMWPVSFAIREWTPAVERKVAGLVRAAVS
jgi:fatty-acyl-CoA synthase